MAPADGAVSGRDTSATPQVPDPCLDDQVLRKEAELLEAEDIFHLSVNAFDEVTFFLQATGQRIQRLMLLETAS